MHIMPRFSRPVCLFLVLALTAAMFTGCASKQSAEQQQVATKVEPQKKKGLELNPLKWPWNPMEWSTYGFREKYNFKVGNMWVIKPPRELNPSQIVVVRQLAKVPDQPQTQPTINMLYDDYVGQKEIGKVDGVNSTVSNEPAAQGMQMLVIDLVTSDALLRDADGREYPSEVDPALTRKLINLTMERDFIAARKTKLKNVNEDQWAYRTVIQEAGSDEKPLRRNWKVSENTNNPNLTEVQRLLTNAFEVAHRAVHPLSESVDLLK
ncbi:MAG: hypothetical protein ACF8OB_15690 [Phycisphaeraceae bacterium JB051]